MENLISSLCINVINTFERLQNELIELHNLLVIHDKKLPVWFEPPLKLHVNLNSTTREQIFKFLSQLEYTNEQEPREILIGAGIVAASKTTIEQIDKINNTKLDFKTAILKLKNAKIKISEPILIEKFNAILATRPDEVATNLKKMGLARLHLKQCYRQIPIIAKPFKISFTWAHTNSIEKIDKQEALELLQRHKIDKGIEQQINKLKTLRDNESLAIVQVLAPHLRANLVFKNGINTTRKMIKGSVPIFYEDETGVKLPNFKPPSVEKSKDPHRLSRNDVKIEREAFLPAIRAHRYIKA